MSLSLFSSDRPVQTFFKTVLPTAAFATLAFSPASGEPVDNRAHLHPTGGEVVTTDDSVATYLRAHPEHPLNGNPSYRFPDGQRVVPLKDQQRQIFATGLHRKVPNGPAGDKLIAGIKAANQGRRVVVTDPRPESLSLSAFYAIVGENLTFTLKAPPQKPGCQPEPGPIEPNAEATGNTGFVQDGNGKAHVPAIPLEPGKEGYPKGAIEFGRSFRARLDAGTLVVAKGKNHLQIEARAELKVSRQIMLHANGDNLDDYKTCIRDTYWESGCFTLDGTPDQPGLLTGLATMVISNKSNCLDDEIPPEVVISNVEPVVAADTPSAIVIPTGGFDTPTQSGFPDVGGNDTGSGDYGGWGGEGGGYPVSPIIIGVPPGYGGGGGGGGGGHPPGGGGGGYPPPHHGPHPCPPPVHAVPEPGSWALMLLGFGVVGAAMRRRTINP